MRNYLIFVILFVLCGVWIFGQDKKYDWITNPPTIEGKIVKVSESLYSGETAVISALMQAYLNNPEPLMEDSGMVVTSQKIGEFLSIAASFSKDDSVFNYITKVTYLYNDKKTRVVKLFETSETFNGKRTMYKPIIENESMTDKELIEYLRKYIEVKIVKFKFETYTKWNSMVAIDKIKNEEKVILP